MTTPVPLASQEESPAAPGPAPPIHTPAALSLLSGGDIYTPLTIDPANEIRLNHVLNTFARLRPGVSLAQAQAEMNAVSAHNGQIHPEIHDWGIPLVSMTDTFVPPDLRTGLLVLMATVLLVLLIAKAVVRGGQTLLRWHLGWGLDGSRVRLGGRRSVRSAGGRWVVRHGR